MEEFSKEEIQRAWDKYPVNWWLKMYDTLFIKENKKNRTPFTITMLSIWLVSFFSLFIFRNKIAGFATIWGNSPWDWVGLILILGLCIPLILIVIISLPAFIMKIFRNKKIAKELRVSLADLDNLLDNSDIKEY
jgi:uncharacterized Tic20 family protein